MVPTAIAQIHGRQRVNIYNFRVGKKENKELIWDFIFSEKQVAKKDTVWVGRERGLTLLGEGGWVQKMRQSIK